MNSLERALKFTLRWEGGFVDHPDDPGGRTDRGISARAHPEVWADGEVTDEEVAEVYDEDYWSEIHGDELPWPVSLSVFDFAVHSGVSRSVRRLQRLISVRVDGAIGPKTLRAVAGHSASDLAVSHLHLRRLYLDGLVRRRPRLAKFKRGWTNRLDALARELARG